MVYGCGRVRCVGFLSVLHYLQPFHVSLPSAFFVMLSFLVDSVDKISIRMSLFVYPTEKACDL